MRNGSSTIGPSRSPSRVSEGARSRESALRRADAAPNRALWASIAGGALLAYGIRRRGAVGAALGTVGAGLIIGGLSRRAAGRRGAGGRRTFEARATFRVSLPVDRVFEFWSHYENFPRFMSNVQEVRETGFGRSHWVVSGPGGVPVEWDAVITQQRPNEVIAWTSVPGSEIRNSGIVRFCPDPRGGTRVEVLLEYRPPAGAAGHTVARLFHVDPQTQLNEDVERLKALLEQGSNSSFARPAYARASVVAH